MSETAHPIEVESYRILRDKLDLSAWPPLARAVVGRVIHATADLDFATSMVVTSESVDAGITALHENAPVICDVEMLRAGIPGLETLCFLSEALGGPSGMPTRSAAAIGIAAERHPDGAIFVIGCAPTALFEVIRLTQLGLLKPALVVGIPVGFVGAAESKAALRKLSESLGIPAISNIGDKGGSAAAAAAINAIVRLAHSLPGSSDSTSASSPEQERQSGQVNQDDQEHRKMLNDKDRSMQLQGGQALAGDNVDD